MQVNSKVLAFDLGNVLFGFDYTLALNKIKGRMKATIPEVIYSLYQKNFTIPFEKGLVSGEEFHRSFMQEFGINFSYSEFVGIWCQIFFPINEVIDLVKRLRSKYPLYLISNINQLHFKYLNHRYPDVFSLFKGLVLSYAVNSVKPEKKIYQLLADAAGVPFSSLVYIDDRQDLIDQAQKFELNCILFKDCQQLFLDLEKINIKLG